MSPNARIWIYQSNRDFTEIEILEINKILYNFVESWTAHGTSLLADAQLILNRFIVFSVDESQALASGCSIDKSVAIVRQLQQQYNVNLLDRTQILYIENEKFKSEHFNDLKEKFSNNLIADSALFFDNTITKLNDFRTNWLKPILNSWLQ